MNYSWTANTTNDVMPKLKNTLVDACVVIGVDHNTDLTPSFGGPKLGAKNSSKYGPFKQHVLAVFTESLAYFPESTTRIEGLIFPLYSVFFNDILTVKLSLKKAVHGGCTSSEILSY